MIDSSPLSPMADTARIEELRRRVQMDPASIAFAALAEEYRRSRQFDEAIAMCRTGLQRHPAYLSARVTLGRSLLEIGRLDEAREELEHVLRVAPENLAAIRALGRDPVLVLSASADLERMDNARGVGRARCVPVGVQLSSAEGLPDTGPFSRGPRRFV